MAKKYRYYGSSLSRHMEPAVKKHLPKIGQPVKVEGLYHGKNAWFEVIVTGTAGKLVLRGCSWGYHGEGPRATEAVLRHLGCHPFDVAQVAFCAPQYPAFIASKKPVWRLWLPTGAAQLAEGKFMPTLSKADVDAQVAALKAAGWTGVAA